MTALEIIKYYAGLLVIQYVNKPKASATVETSVTGVVMPQADLTKVTLPIAVQDAFALTGSPTATGVQLDILGKYVGVSRSGIGASGPLTLDDTDFLTLIRFAIATNNFGSSLKDITGRLYEFFGDELLVIDLGAVAPMQMTYVFSRAFFSDAVLELVVAEGRLPKPMGVGIAAIAPPALDVLFGYCSYQTATPTDPMTPSVKPYNCGSSYTLGDVSSSWVYMDYDYSIPV